MDGGSGSQGQDHYTFLLHPYDYKQSVTTLLD